MVSLLPKPMFNRMNRLDYDSALKVAMRRAKLCDHLKSAKKVSDKEAILSELIGGVVHFYSNTRFQFGPVALTTTLTTNIFNPGTTTGGVACTSAPFDKLYVVLNHLRVVNKTGTAATVSLWIGATGANAAGTEFAWNGSYVSAQGSGVQNWLDWYGNRRLGTADFLVGGSATATALTVNGEGEIGVGA